MLLPFHLLQYIILSLPHKEHLRQTANRFSLAIQSLVYAGNSHSHLMKFNSNRKNSTFSAYYHRFVLKNTYIYYCNMAN